MSSGKKREALEGNENRFGREELRATSLALRVISEFDVVQFARTSWLAARYAGNTIPSRLRLGDVCVAFAVSAPVITFLNAAWNCSISGRVPMVIRA